jgi:hypothetical protein
VDRAPIPEREVRPLINHNLFNQHRGGEELVRMGWGSQEEFHRLGPMPVSMTMEPVVVPALEMEEPRVERRTPYEERVFMNLPPEDRGQDRVNARRGLSVNPVVMQRGGSRRSAESSRQGEVPKGNYKVESLERYITLVQDRTGMDRESVAELKG